eukprot:g28783.t1
MSTCQACFSARNTAAYFLYDLWESFLTPFPRHQTKKLGPSVEMYLHLSSRLGWFYLAAGCISAGSVYFTLHSQQISPCVVMDEMKLNYETVQISTHISVTLLFCVFFWYLHRQLLQHEAEEELKEAKHGTTVLVEMLPPNAELADLQAFFLRWGQYGKGREIAAPHSVSTEKIEASSVQTDGKGVIGTTYIEKRGVGGENLTQRLLDQDADTTSCTSVTSSSWFVLSNNPSRANRVEEDLEKELLEIEAYLNERPRLCNGLAFVSFATPLDATQCVDAFRTAFGKRLCWKYRQAKAGDVPAFNGRYLIVSRPPRAVDVAWTNIEMSTGQKLRNRASTIFFFLIAFSLTVYLSVFFANPCIKPTGAGKGRCSQPTHEDSTHAQVSGLITSILVWFVRFSIDNLYRLVGKTLSRSNGGNTLSSMYTWEFSFNTLTQCAITLVITALVYAAWSPLFAHETACAWWRTVWRYFVSLILMDLAFSAFFTVARPTDRVLDRLNRPLAPEMASQPVRPTAAAPGGFFTEKSVAARSSASLQSLASVASNARHNASDDHELPLLSLHRDWFKRRHDAVKARQRKRKAVVEVAMKRLQEIPSGWTMLSLRHLAFQTRLQNHASKLCYTFFLIMTLAPMFPELFLVAAAGRYLMYCVEKYNLLRSDVYCHHMDGSLARSVLMGLSYILALQQLALSALYIHLDLPVYLIGPFVSIYHIFTVMHALHFWKRSKRALLALALARQDRPRRENTRPGGSTRDNTQQGGGGSTRETTRPGGSGWDTDSESCSRAGGGGDRPDGEEWQTGPDGRASNTEEAQQQQQQQQHIPRNLSFISDEGEGYGDWGPTGPDNATTATKFALSLPGWFHGTLCTASAPDPEQHIVEPAADSSIAQYGCWGWLTLLFGYGLIFFAEMLALLLYFGSTVFWKELHDIFIRTRFRLASPQPVLACILASMCLPVPQLLQACAYLCLSWEKGLTGNWEKRGIVDDVGGHCSRCTEDFLHREKGSETAEQAQIKREKVRLRRD